jgi:hypothetical protein
MGARPSRSAAFAALALALAARPAAAANPSTYKVGTLPVAPGIANVEVQVAPDWSAQLGLSALASGTYVDENPFSYLSGLGPSAWIHFDGVQDLRLSAAFMEVYYGEVKPLGIPESWEERGILRARYQQPRGAAALYELVQLDLRSFTDPTGVHRFVYRPRIRIGQGFNLDAVRIHSLVLFEEVAFRFSGDGYAAKPFESFRALAGYMWTTRRGTFVSLGIVGQITLNPAATRYDLMWGPVLGIEWRFRTTPAETPPEPADVEI